MVDYQKPGIKKSEGDEKVEKPKQERVITGEVITRKKPLGTRFRDVFFGGEARTVAHYISSDVLLPALRNLVVDSASKGIERLVYGDTDPRGSSRGRYEPRMTYGSVSSYTNYNRLSKERREIPITRGYRAPRSRAGFEEIILPRRQDAKNVMERMQDIVDAFDAVSVADLREMLGLRPDPVDNNWGWIYLNDIEIVQVREGYLLNLPAPELLN